MATQKGKIVPRTAYLTFAFVVGLLLTGTLGEISGFRAFVCSRGTEDFARKAPLIAFLYVAVSLLLAFILVHLLNPELVFH